MGRLHASDVLTVSQSLRYLESPVQVNWGDAHGTSRRAYSDIGESVSHETGLVARERNSWTAAEPEATYASGAQGRVYPPSRLDAAL